MAKQAETNEIVIYLLSHDTCKLTEMQLRQMTEEQLSAYAAEVRRYDEQVEQYKKDTQLPTLSPPTASGIPNPATTSHGHNVTHLNFSVLTQVDFCITS